MEAPSQPTMIMTLTVTLPVCQVASRLCTSTRDDLRYQANVVIFEAQRVNFPPCSRDDHCSANFISAAMLHRAGEFLLSPFKPFMEKSGTDMVSRANADSCIDANSV